MARRFVVEITENEYQKLMTMARHTRKADPEKFKGYTWKEAAQDALGVGIEADWEYGSHETREG